MNDPDTQRNLIQVAAWLDDLARREMAVENIVALGRRAIDPLAHYLEQGPQPISQSRVLAVQLLGRLHDARVPDLLRHLLRAHPLHELPPDLVESEYRVKDAAVGALVMQNKATLDDISWAIQSERLPSAIRAAGTLKAVGLTASLVELLADDVLASPAESALHALLPESTQPVLAAIQAWLDPSKDSPHTRLALVRAFRWLAAVRAPVERGLTDRALCHACSMVRSAAALVMDDINGTTVEALLHGVLNNDPILASACRDRLQKAEHLFLESGLDTLRANKERDIYDNAHPSNAWGRYWLLTRLLQLTGNDVSNFHRLVTVVSEDELVFGVHRWDSPTAATLKQLIHHANPRVRAAAAVAVERLEPVEPGNWLADRLSDRNRHVRWQAYTALKHRIHARYVRLDLADIPLSAWTLNPLKCLHLFMMSRHPWR